MRTTKSNKKVLIKSVRIQNVKTNVIPLKNNSGEVYRVVEPGSNHHIEIYEYKDKKGRIKREGIVVSLFEAVSRSRAKKAVVQREHGEERNFVCSLCKGDMFVLQMDENEPILCCIQEIWESTNIVLRPHTHVGENGDINKTASKLRGYKVTVDPIGRVFRAND
jgi:hypothetical protein